MGIQTAVLCRTQQRLRQLHISKSGASPTEVITDASCKLGDILPQDPENLHPAPTHGELPEDILRLIHFLMPVKDAARAACVSHGFLRSWRCYPRLIFNRQTLGLNNRWLDMDDEGCELDDTDSYVISKIGHILNKHSGIGVKVLQIELFFCSEIEASHLDRWFEFIIKPGIEELALGMPACENKTDYNFPCSLLSNKAGSGTLKSLHLSYCIFHPTISFGCSRSLTSLSLQSVHISEEELVQFLSSCVALEKLVLCSFNNIIWFKVPQAMQQLQYLQVTRCKKLRVIQINAPKVSTFVYGDTRIQLCIADPSQVKHISLVGCMQSNIVFYACTELQSIMPNVETLNLSTRLETINTPMVPSKFLHLKYLNIYFFQSRGALHRYDFFSLVSFLEASPSLATFILRVSQDGLRNDSILKDSDEDQSHLIRISECRHDRLKDVTITGFVSSKSMIELAVHILENASSLKCITLDTVSHDTSLEDTGGCSYMNTGDLLEAQRALEAIRKFVQPKVPSSVNFKVLEPCGKCHTEQGCLI